MTRRLLTTLAAATFAAALPAAAEAATEIQWWHAMTGANNEVVETLAKQFNESQGDYRIAPVFKGTYPETLQAGIAAFRARQPPHILQVFDVGTGVMMAAEGAIVPIADVLEKGGMTFDKSQYLPGIVAYYSKPDGAMLSFPYNSSSPILYFNKDILAKAGIDADNPPKTWAEIWAAARKIKQSGAADCGYTTTWPTWIHLENFAAWNNQQYATLQNGLEGTDIDLTINTPVFVKHWQDLADLGKEGVFRYGGRTSEAKQIFLAGECGLFTESSGGLGDIVKSGMNYGTSALPYEDGAAGAPQNTIPGGASLWVMGGHTDEDYKGVARFFAFLSETDIQVYLHQKSGYLPVTLAAYQATRDSGFYEKNPGREQPILQMMGKPPTDNSKGVRAINLPQLRDIQNEEFEAMMNGQQDAQTALDKAVELGDAAIQQALGQ